MIFCISGILQLIVGLACGFVGNIYVYAVVLFFHGMFGSGGADFVGFVLSKFEFFRQAYSEHHNFYI